MKQNELRIGNYFSPTRYVKGLKIPSGAVGKVQTLRFESVEWVLHDQIPAQVEVWPIALYSEMEPIPLTEEWMLKFGFEDCNDPEFNKYANAKMYYRGFLQVGAHRFGESYIINHPTFLSGYAINHIEYVHQLQNLYFALTGEELTIENLKQNQQQSQPE